MKDLKTETYYMNVSTGSVDTRDGWDYEDETGQTVNAADRGEVVEVEFTECLPGEWVLVNR